MARDKLLVEGSDDQDFFMAYCELIGIKKIDVIPPRSVNPLTRDGCGNLVMNLPILLNQIKAGDIDSLGIVLDADYPPDNNGGFDKKFQLIADKLSEAGYEIPKYPSHKSGQIFTHPDGLPSVGLWIMPDHKSDGMLEGFVESMVSDTTQISLLKHAERSIQSLPATLFNQKLHLIKAKVFTWRAWQKPPGISLSRALNDGVLDRTKSIDFEAWLNRVFK